MASIPQITTVIRQKRVALVGLGLPSGCLQTNEHPRPYPLHLLKVQRFLTEVGQAAQVEVFNNRRVYSREFTEFDCVAISLFSSYSLPYCLQIARGALTSGQDVIVGGAIDVYARETLKKIGPINLFFGRVKNSSDWFITSSLENGIDIVFVDGCGFGCRFCSCVASTPRPLLGPVRAATEFEKLLRRFPAAEINIEDTCFFSLPRWYREFLSNLRGPLSNVVNLQTRADLLDQESLELLRQKMPRVVIHLGLERFDTDALVRLGKTGSPAEYLKRFWNYVDWAELRGVHWTLNFVVGCPGDDRDSLEELFDECYKRAIVNRIGALLIYEHFPGNYFRVHEDYYRNKYGTVFPDVKWENEQIAKAFLPKPSAQMELGDVLDLLNEFVVDNGIRPDLNWRGD